MRLTQLLVYAFCDTAPWIILWKLTNRFSSLKTFLTFGWIRLLHIQLMVERPGPKKSAWPVWHKIGKEFRKMYRSSLYTDIKYNVKNFDMFSNTEIKFQDLHNFFFFFFVTLSKKLNWHNVIPSFGQCCSGQHLLQLKQDNFESRTFSFHQQLSIIWSFKILSVIMSFQ